MYSLSNAAMAYDGASVLRNISITFPGGQFAAIAGPNGAGKSTLLHIMAGLRSGYSGSCRFLDREVRSWPRREFSRLVSVVPQSLHVEFAFSAEQIVLMGRAPFASSMFESAEDLRAVHRALELTGTLEFRDRDVRTLSGGERQRVIVAAALAQSPQALLLDEPTTFLDIEHQIQLYRLLRDLADQGVLVIAVTHDLNLAAQYADRITLLRAGQLQADGTPAEILNEETIRTVFRVNAWISEEDGRRWIHYAP